MNDLLEFLTSQEIMVVYIIAAILFVICIITYIVKLNSDKRRMRNNTRELNKLVEEVGEITDISREEVSTEPVLEPIIEENTMTEESVSVNELIDNTTSLEVQDSSNDVVEEKIEAPVIISNEEIISDNSEELEYTTIEPSKEDAKEELARLRSELETEEGIADIENIALNNYEVEQEASAIISLDELMAKSKDMYRENELRDYSEEGNAPISIDDLEREVNKKVTEYSEPFIIDNVVTSEITEADLANNDVIKESLENTGEYSNEFKSSPIISPIYGIESDANGLELENTANYEKLDEEIKKTNEFLMTLRELQKKLD